MRSWATSKTSATVSSPPADDRLCYIVIFVTALGLLPLSLLGGAKLGFGFILAILPILLIAVLIMRWPVAGFYATIACVVLIENGPLPFPDGTDGLPIFHWPIGSVFEGSIERPIGFFFIFIFFILISSRFIRRQKLLQGGQLLIPFVLYLLCVAGGIVHGLTSGGSLKNVVLEVRPFWYLFVSYMLAYNLVTRKVHVRTTLWIVILGAGIKSLQGLYIYLVILHGNIQNVEAILAHEESFFFISLILLLVLFCLHHSYRPQLYLAALIFPAVLIALVANQRRADYIALVVGLAFVWVTVFHLKPHARKALILGMLIVGVLSAGYVFAFSHDSGIIAEPARALMSIVNPGTADVRDLNSNMYRGIEDYDLKYTARLNLPLGLGFGKPFSQPLPLPDVSASDPIYLIVPHNNIFWILMRLGPLGYLAFWYLIGAVIVRGSLIARQLKDRYLQLVAIYVVGVTVMEIVVAFADYQLYFYRNVIYLGLLIGVLMKLPVLDKQKEPVANEATGAGQIALETVRK
jgi:hypothetical protein